MRLVIEQQIQHVTMFGQAVTSSCDVITTSAVTRSSDYKFLMPSFVFVLLPKKARRVILKLVGVNSGDNV